MLNKMNNTRITDKKFKQYENAYKQAAKTGGYIKTIYDKEKDDFSFIVVSGSLSDLLDLKDA
jgi:hypothetical protein